MTMRKTLLLPLLLAFALVLLLACNGASGSASIGGGHGRLAVHLTDAPLDLSNVASVTVNITSVIVYPGVQGMDGGDEMDDDHDDEEGEADEGDEVDDDDDATEAPPIILSTHPETFDLLTLTGGATELLASGEVPEGFYKRIRLEVSSATITYTDGGTAPLKIESGKVDVPIGFHVTAGADASIVLDFDAAASVKVNETGNGQLILRPVVTPKRS